MERKINQEIPPLYRKASRYLKSSVDSYLVTKSVSAILRQRYAYKKEWVRMVRITLVGYKEKYGSRNASLQRQKITALMATFFSIRKTLA